MEIGDIVRVKLDQVIKGPNASQVQKRLERGMMVRDYPTKGEVIYMGERFATLNMLDRNRKRIYNRSFYYDQIIENGEQNV